MRLSDLEKNTLLVVFKSYSNVSAKIYLFGSRANDDKKGGDIDLLLVFANETEKLSFRRLDFLVELKKKIGDRKIDLTLATLEQLEVDVFLKSVFDSAVELEP